MEWGSLQRSSLKGPRQGHSGAVDQEPKVEKVGLSYSREGITGEGLGELTDACEAQFS